MKIAVTGGTGCLGMPLMEMLVHDDFCINLLALPHDRLASSFTDRVRVITGNLNAQDVLKELIKDCDVVFHLAGKVHSLPKTTAEEREFYTINVDGTKSLLEAARLNKVKRIVFYSTVGVYGKDSEFHGDEFSPCHPVTAYGKSKLIAEQLVLNAHKDGGPEGTILRFPVVYGPLDHGNVASLIRAIYRKNFFYFGDGTAKRSMIGSGNSAEAALRAALEASAANQIFCVTDDQDHTLIELVEAVCKALNTKWRPFHVPLYIARFFGRSGDLIERLFSTSMPINSDRVRKLSRPLTFSCEKAKQVFGYEPTETFTEGIFKEVNWLKKINKWK